MHVGGFDIYEAIHLSIENVAYSKLCSGPLLKQRRNIANIKNEKSHYLPMSRE